MRSFSDSWFRFLLIDFVTFHIVSNENEEKNFQGSIKSSNSRKPKFYKTNPNLLVVNNRVNLFGIEFYELESELLKISYCNIINDKI